MFEPLPVYSSQPYSRVQFFTNVSNYFLAVADKRRFNVILSKSMLYWFNMLNWRRHPMIFVLKVSDVTHLAPDTSEKQFFAAKNKSFSDNIQLWENCLYSVIESYLTLISTNSTQKLRLERLGHLPFRQNWLGSIRQAEKKCYRKWI